MNEALLSKYLCIDIEASGLGALSYPIEIALVDPSSGSHICWLIKPPAEWITHRSWDLGAEQIHKITLSQLLERGLPPELLVDDLCVRMAGKHVVSDAPSKDRQWLDILLSFCHKKISEFEMHDLEEVERRMTFQRGLPHQEAVSNARKSAAIHFPKKHRALPDALHNAAVLRYLCNA